MARPSHIHVRPLELGDFEFVRDLASRQAGFTIPPVYVLWLLLRIEGSVCLAAEHSAKGLLAYLLAVPVAGPQKSLFIWQLAASGGTKAMSEILNRLREVVFELSIEKVLFSTVFNSPTYRLIRRYAWRLASIIPERLNPLPAAIDDKETEFLLTVKPFHTKRL